MEVDFHSNRYMNFNYKNYNESNQNNQNILRDN